MTKGKKIKRQTMVHKTIHNKLNIDRHEPYLKRKMNSGSPKSISSLCSIGSTLVLFMLASPVLNHELDMEHIRDNLTHRSHIYDTNNSATVNQIMMVTVERYY